MDGPEFTVHVVDDDTGVLKSLGRLLNAAGIKAHCYSSAEEFLACFNSAVPGCVILDVALPGCDGLTAQEMLASAGNGCPVIFLTGSSDIPTSVRAMKAGAIDFLTKPVQQGALLDAIARAETKDAEVRRLREERRLVYGRLEQLTPRERQVLVRVVAGRLNKQIAADLGTVEKTVKVHRGRVMSKLGVRHVVDLVRLTERAGIVCHSR